MMQKTEINVQEIINEIDGAMDRLAQGIPNAKLTKEDAKDITEQLEDIIALAESIKADSQNNKAKQA